MTFALADYIVILLYIAAILFAGFVISNRKKTNATGDEDYILAGRRVTMPLFVATLVATWYGYILGVGEFVYTQGILAWFSFGVPYYIAAFIFALYIAPKIREAAAKTIPEQINSRYGATAGWISSLIVLVITIPAAYVLMLGVIVQMFSGWPLWASVIAGALISLAYIYTGGLRADIFANAVQFVLMYIGFGALLFFSIAEFGSPAGMAGNLPAGHLEPTGYKGAQYLIVWFIIAFQTFVDPTFHQRCAAALNPSVAKKGILVSILFWIVFDLLTISTGLYAKAFITVSNPLQAFPELGQAVLPPVWKGLFAASLLAAIMSTLDSYSFVSAVTIGNDLIKPIRKKLSLKKISSQKLTKAGLIITAVLAVAISLALPSAIEIIYKTASIAVPGLLAVLAASYIKKFILEKKSAIIIMISSSTASALWMSLAAFESAGILALHFFSQIEPMIPGLLLSITLSFIFVKINKNES